MTDNEFFGTARISRILMKLAPPVMLAQLIQALYNIVDSYFVAQVSQNALTAVSLAFPIQNLLVAFGVGTGVGVSSLISRRLGERDQEPAWGSTPPWPTFWASTTENGQTRLPEPARLWRWECGRCLPQ